MKAKTVITVMLLAFVIASIAFLVIKELSKPSTAPVSPQADEQAASVEPDSDTPIVPEKNTAGRKVIAYYFHGNVRCVTCRTIEAYTSQAIEAEFSQSLENGLLEWKIINLDEPGNEHFVQDFQLVTRSVVIEESVDGKRTRWKNLQRVWDLVGDKDAFLKYVQDEIGDYLEGHGQ